MMDWCNLPLGLCQTFRRAENTSFALLPHSHYIFPLHHLEFWHRKHGYTGENLSKAFARR